MTDGDQFPQTTRRHRESPDRVKRHEEAIGVSIDYAYERYHEGSEALERRVLFRGK